MISFTVLIVIFAIRWVINDAPKRKGWLNK